MFGQIRSKIHIKYPVFFTGMLEAYCRTVEHIVNSPYIY